MKCSPDTKGLPFAEAVPPQSPASTKRRNRKDRNRFTGQRYRPMQSVVCQQAAQTYAKPAPSGATNVRGRTLRVPEGVSLPLRTIGNDTLRRFITDVRKAYRRVCADTRHLWPIHISISKDIRTIHSGSCTDVWTDDTDAGIAVRTCRNTDMEVCRYEDMEAYGRISAKRCSRTETGRRSHKGTNPQGFTYTVKHFNISMLMEKEPVYLAFSTQKGGAGKTTLTVLFASYLHYVKGYDVAGRGLRLPAALHRRDAAARPEAGFGRQPLQGAGLRTVHAPRQESLSGRGEQHGTGHRRCRAHHGAGRVRPRILRPARHGQQSVGDPRPLQHGLHHRPDQRRPRGAGEHAALHGRS